MHIKIEWPSGKATAILKDTSTSRALLKAMPCTSRANIWGEEVYFSMPVDSDLEPDAQQVVPPGTVCFWVEGSSLAIPYGPTPISEGDECRLAAACNVVGELDGDPRTLASVKSGDSISVRLIDG
ncbi:MAG: cyclophilin-like fold protein [Candidatus Marinimicrobia bacterium]|jgi:hypothetical protein|nr:cyclophilin-like fold protein [Candidatus Neomarinimicrobiota bacterium]|tara:strand:+ start:3903 stop:4277 length:375 start_codon:yes stop_codon:yes gene_type:complete